MSQSGVRTRLVPVLTFASIVGILLFWLRLAEGTFLWIYSVAITGFLCFMYAVTGRYRPKQDVGFRPSVTVVIPVKNEQEVIEPVLRTVLESDYPVPQLEVIAVDDGSTDDTWEILQRVDADRAIKHRLTLVKHERNYGKRVALASAISISRGDVIVCIDSDSFVEKDAIRLLVQPFEDPRTAAVCGHGEAVNQRDGFLPRLQHFWYAEMFRLLKGMESCLGAVSCCSGMLAAYRKKTILPLVRQWLEEKHPLEETSVGYLNNPPSALSRGLTGKLIKSPGEDRILTAYALSQKGARVVYQSNAVVHTIVPSTMKQFLKQQLRWSRAWIHGSVFAGRFMWRKNIPAAVIFYLYQFLAFTSPAIVIFWLFVNPFQGAWIAAIGFLAGTIYVGFLHGLNTWNYGETSIASVPYRMAFVFLAFFVTITVVLYAWITPWKMGWVTRTGTDMTVRPMQSHPPVQLEPIEA